MASQAAGASSSYSGRSEDGDVPVGSGLIGIVGRIDAAQMGPCLTFVAGRELLGSIGTRSSRERDCDFGVCAETSNPDGVAVQAGLRADEQDVVLVGHVYQGDTTLSPGLDAREGNDANRVPPHGGVHQIAAAQPIYPDVESRVTPHALLEGRCLLGGDPSGIFAGSLDVVQSRHGVLGSGAARTYVLHDSGEIYRRKIRGFRLVVGLTLLRGRGWSHPVPAEFGFLRLAMVSRSGFRGLR